ncbi:MAG TPA: hypothetical protein VH497_21660 [Vicinamibacterales bacterium]|jgi:hypothetical protein
MPWTDIPKTAVTLSPYLGTGQVTIDDIKLLRYTVVSTDVMTLAFRIHGSFNGGRLNGVIMELAIPYRGIYVASAGDVLTTTPPEGGLTFTNWCLIKPDRGSYMVVPGLVSLVNRKPVNSPLQILIRHADGGPGDINSSQIQMLWMGEITFQVVRKPVRAKRQTRR